MGNPELRIELLDTGNVVTAIRPDGQVLATAVFPVDAGDGLGLALRHWLEVIRPGVEIGDLDWETREDMWTADSQFRGGLAAQEGAHA